MANTIVFEDNFNRGDGGLGANWTTLIAGLNIVSNEAKFTISNGSERITTGVGSPDQYVQTVWTTVSGGTSRISLLLRSNSTGLDTYNVQFRKNNTDIVLYRIIGGATDQTWDGPNNSLDWQDGDLIRAEAITVGVTVEVKVYRNDVLVESFVDSHANRILVEGYTGLRDPVINDVCDDYSTGRSDGSGVMPTEDTYPNGYTHRFEPHVDNAEVIGSDHNNFAVLYKFTDPAFKTTANGGFVTDANGYDVIFTDTSSTLLDFEVESWNGTTGEIIAWFRQPILLDLTDTPFYVYIGNSSVSTDQSNQSGTWNSNYAMVHNFADTVTTLPLDSTSNNNDVTVNYGTTLDAVGPINRARNYNGTTGSLEIAHSSSINITGAITFSMWVRPDGGFASGGGNEGGMYRNGLQHFSSFNDRIYGMAWLGSTGSATWTIGDGTAPGISFLQTTKTSWADDWWFLHGTWDGTTGTNGFKIYVNGILENQSTATTSAIQSATQAIMLGGKGKPGGANYYFDGKQAQLRLLSTELSAGWIETEYNNQSAPTTFVINGTIQVPTAPTAQWRIFGDEGLVA